MLITIALILSIIYGYGMAFTMQTKNFVSSVLFKCMPFAMSTVALVALIGWLKALV